MTDEPEMTDVEEATVVTSVERGGGPMPAPKSDAGTQPASERISLDSVIDVPLRVTVEIGHAKMLVREVLQLNKGSVIPLDRMSGDPTDILVNGRLIARGEVTVVDDALAVRVIELVGRDASERSL